jgi:nucleoside-diphosphate-sugar epimerase
MKILLVGGRSTLAQAMKPLLAGFADVLTAGRQGCDLVLDLADPSERIALPMAFDVVINTAASFGGNRPPDILAAHSVNVLGALRLCRFCTESGSGRLVQVSSIFAELSPDSPFYSSYAQSKRHADEAIEFYAARFGLSTLIVRPSQLYGAGESHRRHQPFLYAMLDKAEARQDIVIYGSNDAQRNFIHVDDAARAMALAVQRELTGHFRCVHPHNCRFSEIAHAAVDAFGSDSRVVFATDRPDIPDNAFEADDRLYVAVGYRPAITMREGLKREADDRRRVAA